MAQGLHLVTLKDKSFYINGLGAENSANNCPGKSVSNSSRQVEFILHSKSGSRNGPRSYATRKVSLPPYRSHPYEVRVNHKNEFELMSEGCHGYQAYLRENNIRVTTDQKTEEPADEHFLWDSDETLRDLNGPVFLEDF